MVCQNYNIEFKSNLIIEDCVAAAITAASPQQQKIQTKKKQTKKK